MFLPSNSLKDNRLAWQVRQNGQRPHWERYDVYCALSAQGGQLFLSYEIESQPLSRGKTLVQLRTLAVFTDEGNPLVKLEKRVDLSKTDIFHADYFFKHAGESFSLDEATGFLEEKGKTIGWQIRFRDPQMSLATPGFHFLRDVQLRLSRIQTALDVELVLGFRKHQESALRGWQTHLFGAGVPSFWRRYFFSQKVGTQIQVLSFTEQNLGPWFRRFRLHLVTREGSFHIARWFFGKTPKVMTKTAWDFDVRTLTKRLTGAINIPAEGRTSVETLEGKILNMTLAAQATFTVWKRTRKGWTVAEKIVTPAQGFCEWIAQGA